MKLRQSRVGMLAFLRRTDMANVRNSEPTRHYLPVILATILFQSLSPVPSKADLAHGNVDFRGGGFDFSAQQQYQTGIDNIDLAWCIIVIPPLGDQLCIWNGAGILAVPDSSLSDISWAPTDIADYEPFGIPVEGMRYIVKTGDGFYVKFAITQFQPTLSLTIEYYVQLDGTNSLRDDIIVPVRTVTWGKIKALYR